MSVDAGLHIQLEAEGTGWPLSVLGALSRVGWRMDDHGTLVYLPRGDDDDFGWTALSQGAGNINEILLAKLRAGEPLGVVLTWESTQIGGTVIIRSSGTFTFSASINRQCLGGSSTTDVSWYLSRLLPALASSGVHISSWAWTEAA